MNTLYKWHVQDGCKTQSMRGQWIAPESIELWNTQIN